MIYKTCERVAFHVR